MRLPLCLSLWVCDYGPILHRFWDMALAANYLLQNCLFILTRLSFCAPAPYMFCMEFRGEVKLLSMRKLKSMEVLGLPYSSIFCEDRMIVAGVVLTWYRTLVAVRRTDGISIIQRSAEANYADAARCKKHYIVYNIAYLYGRPIRVPCLYCT